ncbi:MAG: hypothetical protein IPK72_24025 [Candidatus Eisenbacteria bacterium]|nr:hypothetical protein [Candidatus Eisenbacteria bacterium]
MAEGLSAHAAAMALGCAPSTAWRVALRFRAEGGRACSIGGRRTGRSRSTKTFAAESSRSGRPTG